MHNGSLDDVVTIFERDRLCRKTRPFQIVTAWSHASVMLLQKSMGGSKMMSESMKSTRIHWRLISRVMCIVHEICNMKNWHCINLITWHVVLWMGITKLTPTQLKFWNCCTWVLVNESFISHTSTFTELVNGTVGRVENAFLFIRNLPILYGQCTLISTYTNVDFGHINHIISQNGH